MNRRLVVAALALGGVVALGCGEKNTNNPPENGPDTAPTAKATGLAADVRKRQINRLCDYLKASGADPSAWQRDDIRRYAREDGIPEALRKAATDFHTSPTSEGYGHVMWTCTNNGWVG
jgi:hypothetical protein